MHVYAWIYVLESLRVQFAHALIRINNETLDRYVLVCESIFYQFSLTALMNQTIQKINIFHSKYLIKTMDHIIDILYLIIYTETMTVYC